MLNILSVLLRFAEPFMDANYTKVSNLAMHSYCFLSSRLLDGSD